MARLRTQGQSATKPQRRHRPDYMVMLFVGLLMLFGLVVMYAIGPQRAQVLNSVHQTDYYTSNYFVIKQAMSLGVAVVAMVALAMMPLSLIKAQAHRVLLLGIGASVLLFLLGNLLHVEAITKCTLGACRWFDIGPVSFQPAELIKFGVLIYLARFVASKIADGKLNDWSESILPILILTGVVSFFVVFLQKDLGTGISIIAIIATILMVAGLQTKLGLKLLAGLLAFGVLMVLVAPHRLQRVQTYLGGQTDSTEQTSDSYHISQAIMAIGSGGLLGVGIGNSVQATGYLPEAINDSVFAIIGETFGFLGLMILIVLFTTLLLRLLRISERVDDVWMKLTVAGVFGWLASHIVLNIASMTGVFPLTGITLPLLSFGGTSMVFMAAALGLVLHISRYTTHKARNIQEVSHANARSRRGVRRTRYASSRSY